MPQANLPIRGVQILRSYDAPSSPRKDNRGTVERGIERELYFTEPPDFHIYFSYILRPSLEGRALERYV